MKKLSFTCLLFLFSLLSFGQTFEWVRSYGSTNYDRIWDAEVHGNQIGTIGSFDGALTFNPTNPVPNVSHNGGGDILLNIYTTSGQLLVSKAFGGAGIDWSRSLDFDKWGNIYVTGTFSGSVNFDRSTTGSFTKTSNGGTDVFLAKFDSIGNAIWVKTFGGTSNDEGINVVVNASSEVIVTGTYSGTVDFDPNSAIQNATSNSNSTDIFLSKFDSAGNLIWNKTFGSSSNNDASREIAIDRSNNIIFVGFYGGTIDFDPSPAIVNLPHSSQVDAFITKLDNQGNLVWAKNISSSSEIMIKGVKISKLNEVVVGGHFYNTVDFDPSSATAFRTSNGSKEMFVLKLDSNSNFDFVKTLGSSSADVVEKIELDSYDNIFCTGYYFGNMDFDPSPTATVSKSNAGSSDTYLLKLDKNGLFQWVTTYSGSNTDIGTNIVCDNSRVYLVGNASSPADFDPSPSIQGIPNYGLTDGFITKLNDCTASDSSIFVVACNSYSSPSGNYRWTASGNYSDTLINQVGCDSVLTINLFITNQNTSVTQNGFTLTSNASNSTFQWLDCSNNYTAIQGETNASYTVTQNGDYAVELTENGCKDTSACTLVLGVGIAKDDLSDESFVISPNPSNGQFTIKSANQFNGEVEIINGIGQIIYNEKILENHLINISLKTSPGVYFVRLKENGGKVSTSKVIVK